MQCYALAPPLYFIQPICLDETYILLESQLSFVKQTGDQMTDLESDARRAVLVLTQSHVETGPAPRVAGVFLLLTEAWSLVKNLLDVAAKLQ